MLHTGSIHPEDGKLLKPLRSLQVQIRNQTLRWH